MATTITDLRRGVSDPETYFRLLKIRTKDMRLLPLRLNGPQQKVYQCIKTLMDGGEPVRVIILKARQEGVSTLAQALGFWMSATRRYTRGLVVAHDGDGSDNLFQMSKRFYDHLPECVDLGNGRRAQLRPTTRYSSRKELVFGDLDSSIEVDSAEGGEIGRSGTYQWVHASEVAFWRNAEDNMLAVMQAVPDAPGTMVVLESTANGVGGYFYDTWQRAKRGEGSFIPIFLPWWEMEEYRAPVPGGRLTDLDDAERHLRDAYNLDDEQLQWRRNTIEDKCGGDVDLFRQEYPSNDTEAFLTSGRPFFNATKVQLLLTQARQGDRGYLERKRDGGIQFVPDGNGYLEVWQRPDPHTPYVVGGDVAEGLDHGDYSCLEVLNRDTGEQVAEWHGHIDPDLLGDEAVKLAEWYNRAWIGVEVNNHGLTTNKAIERLRYPRLFYRPGPMDDVEVDTDDIDKLGWRTDAKTRPVMLDDLARAVREGSFRPVSSGLLAEMLTFVRNARGKPEAQAGCFDDRVIAAAITLQLHQLCPMTRPVDDRERLRRSRARRRAMRPGISSITGY